MTHPISYPQKALLFIGNPCDYRAVARWAGLREWATRRGLDTTRTLDAHTVICAIVTDDVVDGHGPPEQTAVLVRARELGIVCLRASEKTQRIGEVVDAALATDAVD
jgi:hypothetical protein